MIPYRILITPMREGGYLVTFPGLKYCMTDGETLEEAVANAKDVFETYVECGCQLPDPEYYEDGEASWNDQRRLYPLYD